QRFSDLALVAFAVVGASGVATAWLHLGEARNLLDTTWGRLVLVKVALFAVIGVLAWLNRRRRLPALTPGGDPPRRAFRTPAGAGSGGWRGPRWGPGSARGRGRRRGRRAGRPTGGPPSARSPCARASGTGRSPSPSTPPRPATTSCPSTGSTPRAAPCPCR